MKHAIILALVGVCKSLLDWLWKDTASDTQKKLSIYREEDTPIIPPIPSVNMDEGVSFSLVRQWETEGKDVSLDDYIEEHQRAVDAYDEKEKTLRGE